MNYFNTLICLLIAATARFMSGNPSLENQDFDCIKRALCCKAKCGTVPYPSNTGTITPCPIIASLQVWSFVSEPTSHPMKVTINTYKKVTSSGFIFVAPYAFSSAAEYGQSGSLILDNDGNPIWFRPLNSPNLMNTDFRVQKLNGKSVLTFWQGTLATPPAYTNAPVGSSEPGSCYYILDDTYRVIKTVKAKRGFTSDIHEFLLTPQNTALLLSTKKVAMDLTPYGGPKNGYVQDFAIQEIDLETNELLFFWNALKHIPLNESYQPVSSASASSNIWDAFHLNSIGLTDDEHDILVSGRNTWTIYRINKPTKKIMWRLGGKNSDFDIDTNAKFSWQHDARFHPHNMISLFDDNCCQSSIIPPQTPFSHGLLLQLDLIAMTAQAKRTYFHDPNLNSSSQGNMQRLKNGNIFIGWGQSPYYAEYEQAGNTENDPSLHLLYDVQIPVNNYTYRAYRYDWIGRPHYSPRIAVRSSDGQIIVYASWNGSTQTAAWQVFAGTHPDKLAKIKVADRTGFETAMVVAHQGPYFKVKALNAQHYVIGQSRVAKLS